MENNEDNMDQIKGSMETLSAMQMILELIREGILTVKEGTKWLNMEEKELDAPGFAFYHKLPSIVPQGEPVFTLFYFRQPSADICLIHR